MLSEWVIWITVCSCVAHLIAFARRIETRGKKIYGKLQSAVQHRKNSNINYNRIVYELSCQRGIECVRVLCQ